MYRLILLDIDGTLRDECKGIPSSAKEAITLCHKNGCYIIICTGRSMGTISDEILALPVDGYIAGGGSYINLNGDVLSNKTFDCEKIQKVAMLLQKKQVAYTFESQEKVYMNEKARQILTEMNKKKKVLSQHSQKQFIQEKIVYKNNIQEFQNQPIHKICLWANEDAFQDIASVLADTMEVAQSETYQDLYYYEIIQTGAHKGKAVQQVQQLLNIKKDETICFGDGQNDIAMFEASKIGIAMKKSHASLIEVATSVCEDIWEDGIYKELKRRGVIA